MFEQATSLAKTCLAFSSATNFATDSAGPEIVQESVPLWHATSTSAGHIGAAISCESPKIKNKICKLLGTIFKLQLKNKSEADRRLDFHSSATGAACTLRRLHTFAF